MLDLHDDFPLPLPPESGPYVTDDENSYDGPQVLVGTDPDDGTLIYARADRGGWISATAWRGHLGTSGSARDLPSACARVIRDRNRFDPRFDSGPMTLVDTFEALGVPDA